MFTGFTSVNLCKRFLHRLLSSKVCERKKNDFMKREQTQPWVSDRASRLSARKTVVHFFVELCPVDDNLPNAFVNASRMHVRFVYNFSNVINLMRMLFYHSKCKWQCIKHAETNIFKSKNERERVKTHHCQPLHSPTRRLPSKWK